MAIKKVSINRHNGTDFDKIYPQTTSDLVITDGARQFVSAEQIADWNSKLGATNAGTAASKDVGTEPGNVPVLDAAGKINTVVLPALAITDTFPVDSETEMLALDAQKGDVAVRSDQSKTYILSGESASDLTNWTPLTSPTDGVESVNGRKGVVTLVADDVGLGKVENKTVAEILVNAALTGTPTAPTPADSSNDESVATTKFVKTAMANMPQYYLGATMPTNAVTGDYWYEEII